MNLLDNIVWFIILGFLLTTSVSFISGIFNLLYINQSTYTSTSIIDAAEQNLKNIVQNNNFDKNHISYHENLKSHFLSETFSWIWLNLSSSSIDGQSYQCFNYTLEWTKLRIHESINPAEDIDIYNHYLTDELWEEGGSTFMNVLCLYHTYDFIWSSDTIDINTSPISYVIYSFFEDLKMSNQVVSKKGILYFN